MSNKLKPTTSLNSVLGKVIAHKRTQGGWDQVKFAKKLRWKQPTLSRMERGVTGISIQQLNQVAKVLGTTGSDLLYEAEEIAKSLQQRGVQVCESDNLKISPELMILGAAALGGLIATILANRK